jgi:hypothetical protein
MKIDNGSFEKAEDLKCVGTNNISKYCWGRNY